MALSLLQMLQTTLPQALQWCLYRNIPKAFAHIVQRFTSSFSIHPTFPYSPESTVLMNILLTFCSFPTILISSSVMELISGSVNSYLIYCSKARKIQDFSPLKSEVASPPSSLESVKLCLECNTRKADNDKEDIDRRCCICNAIPFLLVRQNNLHTYIANNIIII